MSKSKNDNEFVTFVHPKPMIVLDSLHIEQATNNGRVAIFLEIKVDNQPAQGIEYDDDGWSNKAPHLHQPYNIAINKSQELIIPTNWRQIVLTCSSGYGGQMKPREPRPQTFDRSKLKQKSFQFQFASDDVPQISGVAFYTLSGYSAEQWAAEMSIRQQNRELVGAEA